MILDFMKKHRVDVDTTHCQETTGDELLEEIKLNSKAPRSDELRKKYVDGLKLNEKKSEMLHTLTMKDAFLVKRARPNLEPVFEFLATRVRASTKYD